MLYFFYSHILFFCVDLDKKYTVISKIKLKKLYPQIIHFFLTQVWDIRMNKLLQHYQGQNLFFDYLRNIIINMIILI